MVGWLGRSNQGSQRGAKVPRTKGQVPNKDQGNKRQSQKQEISNHNSETCPYSLPIVLLNFYLALGD
jgi:hypothetical protein